jgi:hypothetical protein
MMVGTPDSIRGRTRRPAEFPRLAMPILTRPSICHTSDRYRHHEVYDAVLGWLVDSIVPYSRDAGGRGRSLILLAGEPDAFSQPARPLRKRSGPTFHRSLFVGGNRNPFHCPEGFSTTLIHPSSLSRKVL